jgi:hypothetical protein
MSVEEDPTLLARGLPRQIEPERDLWPQIEARLREPAPEARPRRWFPAALAASLALAAGVGFWFGNLDGPNPDPAIAALPSNTSAGQRERSMPASLPLDVQLTRAELVTRLERQISGLPPEFQTVVIRNLAVINDALDEIDAALADTPDNGADQRLLMAMYADQLALLTSMNTMLYRPRQEIAL